MLKRLPFLALALIGGAVHAQPSAVTVTLTNFKFTPAQIVLKANTPVQLVLRNDSSGGHSFTAPQFFAASRLEPSSAALVHAGRVEVPAHQSIPLAITPAAGTYPLKCSHTLHSAFGMNGTIVVR